MVELEKFHFAAGQYTGDNVPNRVIELGFTPKAVFLWGHSQLDLRMLIKDFPYEDSIAKIVPNGFLVVGTNLRDFNCGNLYYTYSAFGWDE